MIDSLIKITHIVRVLFLLQLGLISCLVTVPIKDDLLGPGECPKGSFCIDSNYCTNTYYATKSGLPFFCGPTHKIDSMICCIRTSAAVVNPPEEQRDQEQEENADEPFSVNDLQQMTRTNRSTVYDDDDEVDILALPFDDNPYDDITLPHSSAELEGRFNTPRDLEAMLEDVIEQELASEERQEQSYEDSEEVEDLGNSIRNSDATMEGISDGLEETSSISNEVGASDLEEMARASSNPPEPIECASTEKIVYIPVFVDANGYARTYYPPPPGSNQVPPVSIPPVMVNHHGQRVPQHPNPTIISYSIPINPPPSNYPSPPPPQPQPFPPVTPLPHPNQQQYPQYPPHVPVIQQPPPQPIPVSASSIPYADSLAARLTRHAAPGAPRPELRRRYVRANNYMLP